MARTPTTSLLLQRQKRLFTAPPYTYPVYPVPEPVIGGEGGRENPEDDYPDVPETSRETSFAASSVSLDRERYLLRASPWS